ncbi:MAG: hypothetical protein HQK49_20590 [Oligoflexia bacterium]|nr:hypothetical protein [Oligoflexia bacterium]
MAALPNRKLYIIGKFSTINVRSKVTFSLAETNINNSQNDNALFLLEKDIIKSKEIFSYDEKSNYTIYIQVRDESNKIIIAKTFSIRITSASFKQSLFYGYSDGKGYANGKLNEALFDTPTYMTKLIDPINNKKELYVIDNGNNVVRKIDLLTSEVSLFVGKPGVIGLGNMNDLPRTAVELKNPRGIANDGSSLYIIDDGNTPARTYRKVRQFHIYSTSTKITFSRAIIDDNSVNDKLTTLAYNYGSNIVYVNTEGSSRYLAFGPGNPNNWLPFNELGWWRSPVTNYIGPGNVAGCDYPINVAIDKNNNIYYTTINGNLCYLNHDGVTFSNRRHALLLSKPTNSIYKGIDVGDDGFLYVTDDKNTITKMETTTNTDKTVSIKIIKHITLNESDMGIHSMVIIGNSFYVTDPIGHRIKKITPNDDFTSATVSTFAGPTNIKYTPPSYYDPQAVQLQENNALPSFKKMASDNEHVYIPIASKPGQTTYDKLLKISVNDPNAMAKSIPLDVSGIHDIAADNGFVYMTDRLSNNRSITKIDTINSKKTIYTNGHVKGNPGQSFGMNIVSNGIIAEEGKIHIYAFKVSNPPEPTGAIVNIQENDFDIMAGFLDSERVAENDKWYVHYENTMPIVNFLNLTYMVDLIATLGDDFYFTDTVPLTAGTSPYIHTVDKQSKQVTARQLVEGEVDLRDSTITSLTADEKNLYALDGINSVIYRIEPEFVPCNLNGQCTSQFLYKASIFWGSKTEHGLRLGDQQIGRLPKGCTSIKYNKYIGAFFVACPKAIVKISKE